MKTTAVTAAMDRPLYSTFGEIDRIVRGFEDGTLPREEWTHAAHLTMACWYLIWYPEEEAVRRIRSGIIGYNEKAGTANTDTGGYHETITLFWIRALKGGLARAPRESSLLRLIGEVVAGLDDKNLPFEYYSRELLMSREARRSYVEPDLKGFV